MYIWPAHALASSEDPKIVYEYPDEFLHLHKSTWHKNTTINELFKQDKSYNFQLLCFFLFQDFNNDSWESYSPIPLVKHVMGTLWFI